MLINYSNRQNPPKSGLSRLLGRLSELFGFHITTGHLILTAPQSFYYGKSGNGFSSIAIAINSFLSNLDNTAFMANALLFCSS
jgi:hypothetical protein